MAGNVPGAIRTKNTAHSMNSPSPDKLPRFSRASLIMSVTDFFRLFTSPESAASTPISADPPTADTAACGVATVMTDVAATGGAAVAAAAAGSDRGTSTGSEGATAMGEGTEAGADAVVEAGVGSDMAAGAGRGGRIAAPGVGTAVPPSGAARAAGAAAQSANSAMVAAARGRRRQRHAAMVAHGGGAPGFPSPRGHSREGGRRDRVFTMSGTRTKGWMVTARLGIWLRHDVSCHVMASSVNSSLVNPCRSS